MIDKNKLKKLYEIINDSNNIVFFGGAGISTASGIPDFRGANGLYNYTPEEIISHSFFVSNTKEFYEFYLSKMVYKEAKPNECHKALKILEDKHKLLSIVTQNIDGLHQEAGSKKVYELHGSIMRNYCMKCGKFYTLEEMEKSIVNGVPKCSCGGKIKPDVVLYEEPLDDSVVMGAINDIRRCDTLIIAGTSLVVYPAAGFIRYFRGKNIVVINLGETNYNAFVGMNSDLLVIDGKVEDYLNCENVNKFIK